MMNLEHELIWMRRRDYMRQAEHHRLLRIATANHLGAASKVMAWTGRRLVALGEGLQGRATTPTPVVLFSEPCL